jgi:hemoglobin/transferrin/lactoferrin receptor protein
VNAVRTRINPTAGTTTPQNPQFPNDATYDRFGTFVNWDVDLTDRLHMSLGTRYENVDASGTINAVSGTRTPFQRNYNDWIGGVGFVYELTEELHAVGGVNQGFRAPNLDDLTADNTVLQVGQDSPSLDVQPERSLNYEVGLKLNTPRLRMQIVEFWMTIDDQILREQVLPGQFVRANFDTYINGTELQGDYLLTDTWSLYGNFAYIYGQDLTRNDPLSRIPPTQGVLGLRWRDNETRSWFEVFTFAARRQDRYAEQNLGDSRFPVGGTPGYGLLNARMGTALGCDHQHRLSFALENITNQPYRVLGSGVDGTGINAIFGYEWVR